MDLFVLEAILEDIRELQHPALMKLVENVGKPIFNSKSLIFLSGTRNAPYSLMKFLVKCGVTIITEDEDRNTILSAIFQTKNAGAALELVSLNQKPDFIYKEALRVRCDEVALAVYQKYLASSDLQQEYILDAMRIKWQHEPPNAVRLLLSKELKDLTTLKFFESAYKVALKVNYNSDFLKIFMYGVTNLSLVPVFFAIIKAGVIHQFYDAVKTPPSTPFKEFIIELLNYLSTPSRGYIDKQVSPDIVTIAAGYSKPAILQAVIDKKRNMDFEYDKSPLVKAIEMRNFPNVQVLCQNQTSTLVMSDTTFNRPLHQMALVATNELCESFKNEISDAVRYLTIHGEFINEPNKDYDTPLTIALKKGHFHFITILFYNFSKEKVQPFLDLLDEFPLLFCEKSTSIVYAREPFRDPNVVELELIYESFGLDIRSRHARKCFEGACHAGLHQFVEHLIDLKVPPPPSSLRIAAKKKDILLLKILLNAGAPINSQDKTKQTALCISTQIPNNPCSIYLLAHNADPTLGPKPVLFLF